jgi:SPP1 gp7 family putative phage head morphogenesis protein
VQIPLVVLLKYEYNPRNALAGTEKAPDRRAARYSSDSRGLDSKRVEGMDNWARNFNSYFRDLSQVLRLLSDKATPKELEKLAAMPAFRKWANEVVGKMAVNVYKGNATSWRDAAAKSGRGRLIYQELQKRLEGTNVGAAVQSIVRENAELISTLPLDIAKYTTAFIAKRQQEGVRSTQIAKELRQYLPRITESRIKLIARTETSKSETALTRARSEDLGLSHLQWLTSHDQRVRRSHRNMEGVVLAWDDPPSPEALIGEKDVGRYLPGCIWNCRCVALSIVDINELAFPIRYYGNNRLTRMTRKQFAKVLERRRAA